jgi:hypothetical protein
LEVSRVSLPPQENRYGFWIARSAIQWAQLCPEMFLNISLRRIVFQSGRMLDDSSLLMLVF